MHDGTPILSAAGNALAHAVSVGLRPIRLDLSNVTAALEQLSDVVASLNSKVETQAGMLEQMGKAVHGLQSDTKTGMADIKLKVGLDKGDEAALKESLQRAMVNQQELVKIRTRLRSYLTREMGGTLLTDRVYLNAADTWEQMHISIEDELSLEEKDAQEYAMSWRSFPSGKEEQTINVRVATPLMRIKSHMLQRVKEAVIPVYFQEIGLAVPPTKKKTTGKRKRAGQSAAEQVPAVGKETSDAWLKDGKYVKSAKGFSAIVKALIKLMLLLGVSYRVVTPSDLGADPHVECTLGHFALVSAIMRGVFEKLSGIKAKRRCGLAGGIFQEFKKEVGLVHDFLPMHDRVENKLRLVDGSKDGRANLGATSESDEDMEELEEEELTLDDLYYLEGEAEGGSA